MLVANGTRLLKTIANHAALLLQMLFTLTFLVCNSIQVQKRNFAVLKLIVLLRPIR
jgi:hypothetical protein